MIIISKNDNPDLSMIMIVDKKRRYINQLFILIYSYACMETHSWPAKMAGINDMTVWRTYAWYPKHCIAECQGTTLEHVFRT